MQWEPHALAGSALLVIVGVQVVALGLCAQLYDPDEPWLTTEATRFRLEYVLIIALVISFLGAAALLWTVTEWIVDRAGPQDYRLAAAAATVLVVGLQILFCTYLLIVLSLRRT